MTISTSASALVLVLRLPDGRRSIRLPIGSPGPASWSHITSQRTKQGTTLELHAPGSGQTPAAVARNRQLSHRPGLAESTQAIAGAFEVVDDEGTHLATVRKRPLRSVLRTTWDLRFDDGSHAVGSETKPLRAVFRRLLRLIELVIDIPVRTSCGFVFDGPRGVLFSIDGAPDGQDGVNVSVEPQTDERVALLLAALTRTRAL